MCIYFLGKYLLSCKAGLRAYMPSDFEMREYCRSSRYKICPLYVKAVGNHAAARGTVTRPGMVRGENAAEGLSHLR